MRKTISLILKLVVIVFASFGTYLSMRARSDTFMGGLTALMYFTIQSNIVIAAICLIGGILILRKKSIPNRWYVIKYIGTMAITITGAVFCFILAPTMGHYAWSPVNIYTHVIVPIAAIADFFLTGVDSDIKKRHIILTTIPPYLYVIFAGIGYINNWEFANGVNYPYFFLNWGSPAGAFGFTKELPFMGCVWWIAILSILVVLVGLLYLFILKMLKKLTQKRKA